MFTLREVTNWFGMTAFELVVFFASLFVYTIFLSLKVDGWISSNWYIVHSPLFLCDAFLAYFTIIVLIRTRLEGLGYGIFKATWRLNYLMLMTVSKFFICLKLEGDRRVSHGEVWAPIFWYLLSLIIRTCSIR